MLSRVGRIATTAVLATGIGFGGGLFGAPNAGAASDPIVVGSCGATVHGESGQPVALDLGAALGSDEHTLLPIGAIPQQTVGTLDALPAIKQAQKNHSGTLMPAVLGTVTTTLSKTLSNVLSQGCNITTQSVNAAAKPVQDAGKPATDALKPVVKPVLSGLQKSLKLPGKQTPPGSTAPGSPAKPPVQAKPGPSSAPAGGPAKQSTHPLQQRTPGAKGTVALTLPKFDGPNALPLAGQLSSFSTPTVPASLLSPIGTSPVAPLGGQLDGKLDDKYGLKVPGYAPNFGQSAPPASGIREAGSARALNANDNDRLGLGNLGLPLLLGVIAASLVAGGLARTWMVRKARGTSNG